MSSPGRYRRGVTKGELRKRLRTVRAEVTDPHGRAARLWERLAELDRVRSAKVLMAYSWHPGEPETDSLRRWCEARGIAVVVPEDEPDPVLVDVIVVPGLGFTLTGARLGRGGGWYDRFLTRVRPDAFKVGVCFAEQLLDELPLEAHDVWMDVVLSA